MHFQHIYDTDLAQGSFLIGCEATGRAVVVDPRRDVEVYLAEAAAHDLRITHVTETHVHADYLSGSRELAQRSGAELWLSDEGGPDWSYRFEARPLRSGGELRIGTVRLQVLHTPGHTPEHLSFLVTDTVAEDEPIRLLSGDFVFVGDVGRPDLLDQVAGGEDTRIEGAHQLFASLRDRFLPLPDHVQVWPGHGAGSACGKALGSAPSSTVGQERSTAWWAGALDLGDEEGFVASLLEGQPDTPAYFGRMKRWNLAGPPLLGERAPLPELDAAEVAQRLQDGEILFADTRGTREWQEDAVSGALHLPDGDRFATYAAFAIDPERDLQEIVLLAADAAHAGLLRDKLARTGIDRVAGFVSTTQPFPRAPVPSLAPAELARRDGAQVLDVRTADEYAEGRIEGARRLHVSQVRGRLDQLPRRQLLVTHCKSGERSSVAASVLRVHGFSNVVELEGSYEGWREYERKDGST